ncbi:MAG: RNA 2',3'-cyclic phosphodiesterase [Thermoanaerobaculia bacterium]
MRLFLAIELPQAVGRALEAAVAVVRPSLPDARWVRAEGLHATAVFLGERAVGELDRIVAIAGERCAAHPRGRARLAAPGVFPLRGPARVAWVALEVAPDVAPLVRDLEAALVEARLLAEPTRRPHSAHVTLARCRSPWTREAVERFRGSWPAIDSTPFAVDSLTLFESELGAGGARYRRLAELPLAEAA